MTSRAEGAGSLSTAGRVYLTAVIACGIAAVASSVFRLHVEPLGYQWYMLAALTFISGSATVTLPSVPASISVSETFVFATVLLFGSAAGTVMVALDGLVISFWMAKRRPEWYRALFNMAAPALSIWCAAHLLFMTARIEPLIRQPATINVLLLPLILFALVYFGLNSWMIALAVALEMRVPPYRVWRENFLWLSLNYFSGASVALLLVVYTRDVDLRFIGVIVPLLLVLYFTYKNSMDRVEDANRHVMELSRLHLSTIETLAMAIDAKDQITHGHIRRVQALAVGLARNVGVIDERLIKAIEAAALLHDMGKLAVPEHILNKPGKLTPAEFEKMKLHAAVGADILSAIDFPYPVVPIVRHHHENWNGSGYPDGLRGTDIPIGARLLSVVDCFDALTSDRPYRPRLTDSEAIAILTSRRGTMYDPLIVDKFIAVHEQIAPSAQSPKISSQTLADITHATKGTSTGGNISMAAVTSNAGEVIATRDLTRDLAFQTTVNDVGDILVKNLRNLIPACLYILYLYDAAADELQAGYVDGTGAAAARGLTIGLGQRLSGWVAANRQTISNSDPALDLGETPQHDVRLRSCLSTALTCDGELIGVVSAYSASAEAFAEEHRRLVEVLAPHVAQALKRTSELEAPDSQVSLQRLARRSQEHERDSLRNDSTAAGIAMTLMFIEIVGLNQAHNTLGSEVGSEVLRHVVRSTRSNLRSTDILFRNGSSELVALLSATDLDSAALIADRIRHSVREEPVVVGGDRFVVDIDVACVCASRDSDSVPDLMRTARMRSESSRRNAQSPSVH
jgi:diguanylate cyclase (GGDEF)-like protein/putative nucleotidyltransferase with HDIG domain